MSQDRYERRQERRERKDARRAERWGATLEDPTVLANLSGPELEAQLRKRVERRMRIRMAFYTHLIVYLGINALLWVIYLTTDPGGTPWPLYVSIPWGVGLAAQAVATYQYSRPAMERREEAIQREIELEKQRLGLDNQDYEKPKRDRVARLSDDGELVYTDDDDVDETAKIRRG